MAPASNSRAHSSRLRLQATGGGGCSGGDVAGWGDAGAGGTFGRAGGSQPWQLRPGCPALPEHPGGLGGIAAPVHAADRQVFDQQDVGGQLGDGACGRGRRGAGRSSLWGGGGWTGRAASDLQPASSKPAAVPEAKPMTSRRAPHLQHFRLSSSSGPPTGSNTTSTPGQEGKKGRRFCV